MTVTFMITKRAHWRALADVTRRTRSYKLSVAFFVVLPAAILLYGLTKAEHMGWYVLDNLALLILGPFLVFVGFPLTYYLTVSRLHKDNAIIGKPQTFEITRDQLVMRGPLHNSDLKWEAVQRVVETRHTFLFFVSKYAAHFIPKEAVRGADIVALRTTIAQVLPSSRLQLRSDTPSVGHAAA
jgi:YcxB-like protein